MTDWLALCRAASAEVARAVDALPGRAEREPVVGAGRGGDDTTAVDAAAERAVVECLRASGESFVLVSEELGEETVGDEPRVRVVVDPIDGSNNAKRGIPHWALSIAVAEGDTMDDVVFGYVHDFGTGEEWTATRGEGAFLDGVRLTQRPKDELEILAFEATTTAAIAERAASMVGVAYRLRIMGSLAIALCNLAAGRARRRLLAEAGAVGRHRRGPAARPRAGPRDRPVRGSAVRRRAARPRHAVARRRGGDAGALRPPRGRPALALRAGARDDPAGRRPVVDPADRPVVELLRRTSPCSGHGGSGCRP